MITVKECSMLYKGSTLGYRKMGRGEVVVLLHGFGEDGSIWDGISQALCAQYRVIVPDLPGTGLSTMLQVENASMTDFADSIAAILNEEAVKTCTMIGHSMGGYVTLAFAEKHPYMLKAFGLFHSSAFADDEAKKEMREKAMKFIRERGSQAFLQTSIPGLFADDEKSDAHIGLLVEKSEAFAPEVLIQYYQAMKNRPDRTEVLANTRCQVLMILGEHDKAVPFELGLKQAHLPDTSYVHILRNSGHMGMLEEPEKSLFILQQFLEANYQRFY
jgi:pimeloyl-ACP methyl ester carboxylesterase